MVGRGERAKRERDRRRRKGGRIFSDCSKVDRKVIRNMWERRRTISSTRISNNGTDHVLKRIQTRNRKLKNYYGCQSCLINRCIINIYCKRKESNTA